MKFTIRFFAPPYTKNLIDIVEQGIFCLALFMPWLKSQGFFISQEKEFIDMIIEYYITNGIYDIYEINAALYRYDQVCLGC